jgi:hypothetical protein
MFVPSPLQLEILGNHRVYQIPRGYLQSRGVPSKVEEKQYGSKKLAGNRYTFFLEYVLPHVRVLMAVRSNRAIVWAGNIDGRDRFTYVWLAILLILLGCYSGCSFGIFSIRLSSQLPILVRKKTQR